jgi:hypothetical protein
MKNPLHNSVIVKCNADGSYLSEFDANGRAIFRVTKSERMILRADDPRLEPYFDAPYEVRDITVTPDEPATFPTVAEQNGHWQRKDDAYEAYLNEMHSRQLDPKYIASYSVWLDDRLEQNDGRDLIVKLVDEYGFVVEDTGGGCQWLRRDLCDGLHMVVTDGEAGLPELTARLYIVKETNGEPVAQSELMTLHEMIDHVAIALA